MHPNNQQIVVFCNLQIFFNINGWGRLVGDCKWEKACWESEWLRVGKKYLYIKIMKFEEKQCN